MHGFLDQEIEIYVNPDSKRLQLLEPFESWDGENIVDLKLLIKAKGKCTTDHISMAGPWLYYRGHLDNISDNLLTGAINYFNDKSNHIKCQIDESYGEVPAVQRLYKEKNIPTIVVGDENYGEGSSREHAPWALLDFGIQCVISPSFADIFYNNCFKNGMLPIILDEKKIEELCQYSNMKKSIEINLQEQEIIFGNQKTKFEIDSFKKKCLLNGLDDIALSLNNLDKISSYENKMKKVKPWINQND